MRYTVEQHSLCSIDVLDLAVQDVFETTSEDVDLEGNRNLEENDDDHSALVEIPSKSIPLNVEQVRSFKRILPSIL